MFGLDERITTLSDGATVWLVVLGGVLLGFRHAVDPDHIAAVTSLVAGARTQVTRAAAWIGFSWGLGHAVALFAFGLPIVLLNGYLPERAQQGAELAIAAAIVALAVRLLRRWRRGHFHVHDHEHDRIRHSHVHPHVHREERAHRHAHGGRSAAGAFGIGLIHGMGGSAGASVLIVAAVDSTALAIVSLLLLAIFTAVSMTILSTGFGFTLARKPARAAFHVLAPVFAVASLGFGIWYGLGALDLAPYYF